MYMRLLGSVLCSSALVWFYEVEDGGVGFWCVYMIYRDGERGRGE
jgi:hypothetical protein